MIGELLAGAAALWALTRSSSSSRTDDSRKEDGGVRPGGAELLDPDVGFLEDTLGIPYTWGGSDENGWDCSGYALWVAVELGQVGPDIPRMTAAQIADACDPVAKGEQRPGDFAYYPGHIMVVASLPDVNGDSAVIGASGGDRTTHGNDPNACVKIYPSQAYRSGFVTFMRWKEA